MNRTFRISGTAELPAVAEYIVSQFATHRIVAFRGGMGAGKTTLIREIARQMDVQDEVTSPTFALVNQYVTGAGQTLNHFDFYRIDRIEEAFDMGYEEYFFGDEVCLIEWPEKIEALMPDETLDVCIEAPSPEERVITVG